MKFIKIILILLFLIMVFNLIFLCAYSLQLIGVENGFVNFIKTIDFLKIINSESYFETLKAIFI